MPHQMQIAVFTNQFPGRVNTFFARDMRALLDAGIEVDVFPIYNVNPELWQWVPAILPEAALPRDHVYHLSLARSLLLAPPWPLHRFGRLLHGGAAVGLSAMQHGVLPLAKSLYTFPKAWAWARRPPREYDHVLAYWGNYSATCAHMFHKLLGRRIPFSMYLHAGTDLYRTQVYLRQKLLYADNIILVCEFNREFIRREYPHVFPRIAHKIHVHHLGLNLADMPFQPDGRHPRRVLGVGTLGPRKGFDSLLRAAGELVRRGVDMEVELVGDGEVIRGQLEQKELPSAIPCDTDGRLLDSP